jgi:protein SYS1
MARRRRPRRSGALGELPPLKILAQIAIIQAILYASLTALMFFTERVSGRDFSFNLVFGWSGIRGDTTEGWLTAFVWILAAGLVGAASIVYFVGRSKLVLDFAATLHAIHLAVVIVTHSIPSNLAWWATMGVSTATAIALGTWGCRHRELQPISFGGAAGGNTSNSAALPPGPSGADGDEEQGFSRGRGRGRGRDGAGEYEMVSVVKTGDTRQE